MLTLRSDEASLADARDLVGVYLEDHCRGVDGQSVRLVVSELVTNALRHAGGAWTLEVDRRPGLLTVGVRDEDGTPPDARPLALDGRGGLGLHIVERLAGRVRVTPAAQGKTVSVWWPVLPAQRGG
ncbi:ATP-binding protein [Streptomyces tremellae]|uniref:ATP-binding protein n=1 Tax=Streptomyces tremellae TaxID=1124239 RepID=A0ABP7EAU3_9ACTN